MARAATTITRARTMSAASQGRGESIMSCMLRDIPVQTIRCANGRRTRRHSAHTLMCQDRPFGSRLHPPAHPLVKAMPSLHRLAQSPCFCAVLNFQTSLQAYLRLKVLDLLIPLLSAFRPYLQIVAPRKLHARMAMITKSTLFIKGTLSLMISLLSPTIQRGRLHCSRSLKAIPAHISWLALTIGARAAPGPHVP